MVAADFFDFVVDNDQSGDRLDKTLGSQPGCSRALARRLIEAGAVFVADRRVGRASFTVRSGQRIRAPRRLPEVPEIDWSSRILYRDEHWLAVDKPTGVPSAPTPLGERGSVPKLLQQQLGLSQCPTVVHRLDHDVSGVLVLALSRTGTRRLTEAFTSGRVRKFYYGLVQGTPDPPNGRIELAIGKDPRRRGRRRVDPHGQAALTEYRSLDPVQPFADCTAVELQLHTGRTHQLRVHLAALGCPLLGDRWYGGPQSICDGSGRVMQVPRLCLHAQRLVIAGVEPVGDLSLEAALPDFLASG